MRNSLPTVARLLRIPDIRHLSALLVLTLWAVLLLKDLMVPKLRIVATPEFEVSDAVNLSYASKVWYGRQLASGLLPVWSDRVGMGFPILGEGQTGIWHLPNLLLYSVLPIPVAYTVSLIAVLAASGWGTYAWLVVLGMPFVPSLAGGMTIAASGYLLFHLQHMALLQGFALMPAIMALSHLIVRGRRHGSHLILYAVLFAQQLFAGFVQAVFITQLTVWLLNLILTPPRKETARGWLGLIGASCLGAAMSSLQLIPSFEFMRAITGDSGFTIERATYFSYPVKQLLTFIHPFIIGSPRNGSFFPSNAGAGNIYWESIGYVGLLPVLTLPGAPFLRQVRHRLLWAFYAVAAVTLILMIGRGSPAYIIFSLFPFNLFRVPARFVIPFALMLVGIYTACLSWAWQSRRLIRWSAIAVSILNLYTVWTVWQGYHLLETPQQILTPPEIVSRLTAADTLYQIHPTRQQRNYFYNRGWTNPDIYGFMRNGLMPNANLLWDIPTYAAYPSRRLRRHDYYDTLYDSQQIGLERSIPLSATDEKLLSLASLRNILSFATVSAERFELVDSYKYRGLSLYLYRNDGALPDAYIACDAAYAQTAKQAKTILSSDSFVPGHSVLLETSGSPQASAPAAPAGCGTVRRVDAGENDTVRTYSIEATAAGYLVVNRTFYPGWTVTVDSAKGIILPANVRFQAVRVAPGIHTVTFTYAPASLRYGGAVTAAALAAGAVWWAVSAVRVPRVSGASPPAEDTQRRGKKPPGRRRRPS